MHQRKGISLIEIVIVMAIFALLATLVMANMRRGEKSQKLREAALTLVDDIRQTQNMTFVGESKPYCKRNADLTAPPDKFRETCTIGNPCATPASYTCTNVVPPGGYGVFFDNAKQNEYILFGDFGDALISGTLEPVRYTPVVDALVKRVSLGSEIVIADVKFGYPIGIPDPACIDYTAPSPSLVSFVWTQPNGILFFNPHSGSSCPDAEITIVLKQTAINVCRTITVSGASGLVDEAVTQCP